MPNVKVPIDAIAARASRDASLAKETGPQRRTKHVVQQCRAADGNGRGRITHGPKRKRAEANGAAPPLHEAYADAASRPPSADDDVYELAPLDQLLPSKTNPRKTFDPKKLEELAESIRTKGVIEPLIVRYSTVTREKYEIVAGERRWRAAVMAQLERVPVIRRELSDAAVLEIQMIENLQRDDLTPLEEAAGYEVLLKKNQYTADALAAKLGRSKSYVYGRLKLLALPAKGKKLLAEGKLPPATAELVARIPNEKLRLAAMDEIAYGRGDKLEVHSYRDAKQRIESRFMVELKRAPFGLADGELLPRAGACQACPKMTGNNRELYPDGRADVCTDPACYEAKVAAHGERLKEIAKSSGRKVLSAAECKKLFPYKDRQSDHLAWGTGYVKLDDCCYEHGQKHYRALIGDDVAADVVLATDAEGRVHELVPEKRAVEALRAKYAWAKRQRAAATSSNDVAWRRQQAKEREHAKQCGEVVRRIMGQVADAVGDSSLSPCDGESVEFYRALARLLCDSRWSDAVSEVAKRRGVEAPQGSRIRDLSGEIDAANGPGALALIAELLTARALMHHRADFSTKHLGAEAVAFFDLLGVSPAKVAREVAAEKKKTAGKGKKAGRKRKGAAR